MFLQKKRRKTIWWAKLLWIELMSKLWQHCINKPGISRIHHWRLLWYPPSTASSLYSGNCLWYLLPGFWWYKWQRTLQEQNLQVKLYQTEHKINATLLLFKMNSLTKYVFICNFRIKPWMKSCRIQTCVFLQTDVGYIYHLWVSQSVPTLFSYCNNSWIEYCCIYSFMMTKFKSSLTFRMFTCNQFLNNFSDWVPPAYIQHLKHDAH